MIELLFIACLTSAPADCQERRLTFVDVTPMACMMGAQPELAKWSQSHPGHSIKSWRCQFVSRAEREA
ncbi:MAG: hypothetical protein AAF322_02460 [Pseudomonadota bacterium]